MTRDIENRAVQADFRIPDGLEKRDRTATMSRLRVSLKESTNRISKDIPRADRSWVHIDFIYGPDKQILQRGDAAERFAAFHDQNGTRKEEIARQRAL